MKEALPPVIGIVGKADSGKTTIAKHLESNHDYVRVSFAEILKDMLQKLGLSREEIYGSLKEEPCSLLLGKTPRHAMQTLGTEWGRDLIHKDLWANAWKVRTARQLALGHKVVCDDCRFENEARFIRTFHGAKIWKVLRLEKDLPVLESVAASTHSSELDFECIKFDVLFSNYATVEELRGYIDYTLAGNG